MIHYCKDTNTKSVACRAIEAFRETARRKTRTVRSCTTEILPPVAVPGGTILFPVELTRRRNGVHRPDTGVLTISKRITKTSQAVTSVLLIHRTCLCEVCRSHGLGLVKPVTTSKGEKRGKCFKTDENSEYEQGDSARPVMSG